MSALFSVQRYCRPDATPHYGVAKADFMDKLRESQRPHHIEETDHLTAAVEQLSISTKLGNSTDRPTNAAASTNKQGSKHAGRAKEKYVLPRKRRAQARGAQDINTALNEEQAPSSAQFTRSKPKQGKRTEEKSKRSDEKMVRTDIPIKTPEDIAKLIESLRVLHSAPVATQPPPPAPPAEQLLRPEPTEKYLQLAATSDGPPMSRTLDKDPLLIVLDLNGTLLYRHSRHFNAPFARRPGLQQFLTYLVAHHRVMVWSSARPHNVERMVSTLETEYGLAPGWPAAVWGRDTLRLTPAQYNQKVQVYKQLSWIWDDVALNPVPRPHDDHDDSSDASGSGGGGVGPARWNQRNTVLIDDSPEKAASEPFNLVAIPAFEGDVPRELGLGVLPQVQAYLEVLRRQPNVSAYMRAHPFELLPTEAEHTMKVSNVQHEHVVAANGHNHQ